MLNGKTIFWIIIGVFAGFLVGSLVNLLIVLASLLFYVPPEGMDWNDEAAVAQFIGGLPAGAFLLALAAHAGHSFVGGWVAASIARPFRYTSAFIVGLTTMAGGIMNLSEIPHPDWFGYVDLLLYLPLALLGARLVKPPLMSEEIPPPQDDAD
ncbi:hypothetical protein LOC68_12290 [Blastopirellula sp. JC732]|uniref:Uncharacterized protein n=1 Tax=Blastopirellula sediminis TaxID=2894196 RepID=A0A9X1MPE2_9BACT|nr:hypothetical protein [Blastopirellula sediminis]MCC9607528.1 hypothetical protein [Blastopirellula sediminis]MCC9629179.1 hypothetical protein [Blastopirellula sediminis]